MKKIQVVSWVNHRAYFTGTEDECIEWLVNYGLGSSQFELMQYDSTRIVSDDICETY